MPDRSSSRDVTLRVSLLLCLTATLAGQEVYRDEAHGFTFEIPSADWVQQVMPPAADGAFIVQTGPPSMSGAVVGQVSAKFPADAGDAEALREYVLGTLEGSDRYGEPELLDATLDGEPAPGLVVDVAVDGFGTLSIRQHYVIAHGSRFVVETRWPTGEGDAWDEPLERWLASVDFLEPDDATLAARDLATVAASLDDHVPWAADWADAARRARADDKLVLARIHQYGGFDLPDDGALPLALDDDVRALVTERFVPVRWRPGQDAPFVAPETYGLGERAFGATFLVLTPDGEVVHEGQELLDAVLRTADAKTRDAPRDGDLDALFARGLLDEVEARITDPTSAAEHLLLAGVDRRRLDAEAALAHLLDARAAPDADAHLEQLDLEQAAVCAGLGRVDEAARRFAGAALAHPARADAALFGLASCLSAAGDARGAEAAWRRLVDEHADSRYGAAAARILTHPAFEFIGPLDVAWPTPDVVALVAPHDRAPLPIDDAARAARDAVAVLLSTQRERGDWLTSAQVNGNPDEPSDLADATTALAALALLDVPGDAPRRAAERALEHLADALVERLADDGEAPYMDYAVWSRASHTMLLAEALARGVGDEASHRATAAAAIDDLVARQQPTGGWTYFLSGDADGEPLGQSISFVTAYVVLALERIAAEGVEIPAEMHARAVAALDGMQGSGPLYAYMLLDDGSHSPPPGEVGASARAPLCTLAHRAVGRASSDDLRDALDVYAAHAPTLTAEAGKRIMHAGPGGLGAHYVLFDHWTSALAVAQLPQGERGRWRDVVLGELLSVRRDDGSFVDLPLMGPCTGSALALLAMRTLDVEP